MSVSDDADDDCFTQDAIEEEAPQKRRKTGQTSFHRRLDIVVAK
jgi:hypothetical protein